MAGNENAAHSGCVPVSGYHPTSDLERNKGINGCLTESDYQTKSYKDEDGHCDDFKCLEKFK